jgi:hypothetical protein
VFAAIGELPDTIADRSVCIRLERRTRDETIERFRRREALEHAEPIRQWLETWGQQHVGHVAEAWPDLPDELDDRAQDVWEPLFAIADLTEGAAAPWSERARKAALALSAGEQRDDDSVTVLLLRDIHAFFSSNGHDRVRTSDLLSHLHEIEESPWGDWYGKALSAQGLSRLLRPHRIKTMPVRVSRETVRGYKVEQFADAFYRVLGATCVTSVASESPSQAEGNACNAGNAQTAMARTETPRLGDEGFPELVLATALSGSHITEAEANERYALHKLVEGR